MDLGYGRGHCGKGVRWRLRGWGSEMSSGVMAHDGW